MKCFVCNSNMKEYFHKKMMLREGEDHEFVCCEKCGLVIDRTAYELDPAKRIDDICSIHSSYQGMDENPYDPAWIGRIEKQATLFAELFIEDIFCTDMKVVDYGCGDGKLSKYFDMKYAKLSEDKEPVKDAPQILKYDKYMKPEGDMSYLDDDHMIPGKFDVVVSCSMMEHFFGKKEVDEIFNLVSETGTFCMHTLICEEVPQDPDWFYLIVDHVTIWTNRAMALLYRQYRFVGCAYNLEARMWFFFRNREQFYKLKKRKNAIDGTWIFSDDFVDYWKQKPYR